MASLLAREIDGLRGLSSTGTGNDGRSDVVLFEAGRGARGAVRELVSAEDLFVEVGRAVRADGDDPRRIAQRVWQPERVERALSAWAEQVRPLAGSMTFRVIARVLKEKAFLRTDLRRELDRVISKDRPRWKNADPASIEIWIIEYAPGKLVAGLRLTDVTMRQRGGRTIERQGALRPSVAAAMVELAGSPGGVLLDPCCGSGTIVGQAVAAGWDAVGSDLDADAVRIARENVPEATIRPDDARKLSVRDGSVAACVSNLPFGRQYGVERHEVTVPEQVIEVVPRDIVRSIDRVAHIGVVRDDAHIEAARAARDCLADASEADDSQRSPIAIRPGSDILAQEQLRPPDLVLPAHHVVVRLGNASRDGQQQRPGEIGRASCRERV